VDNSVVGNRSMVDGVVHKGGVVGNSVVGNRVGKGMASMDKGRGVVDGMGNGEVGGNTVADNGSVSNMGLMGDLGGGSGSKAEEGRDRKGLNLNGSRLILFVFTFSQRLDSLFAQTSRCEINWVSKLPSFLFYQS
jgi:hypothetical protein